MKINPEALPVLAEILKMISDNNRHTLALIKHHREHAAMSSDRDRALDIALDKFEAGWLGIADNLED